MIHEVFKWNGTENPMDPLVDLFAIKVFSIQSIDWWASFWFDSSLGQLSEIQVVHMASLAESSTRIAHGHYDDVF